MVICTSIFSKKEWFVFSGIYFASFFLMLLNNGLYIDDWTYYNINPDSTIKYLSEHNSMWALYLIRFWFEVINNLFVFRLIIVICFFFSAVLFAFTLKHVREIDKDALFYLTVIFAIFPVNFARLDFSTSQYSISYFIFFLALYLVCCYMENGRIALRIISLCFFFVSFDTNSLLIFYAIVLIYIGYIASKQNRPEQSKIYSYFTLAIKYSDFIMLPLLFWIIKNIYFRPYGLFEGYNKVTLEGMTRAFILLPFTFYRSFVEPITSSFVVAGRYALIAIPASIALFFMVKNRRHVYDGNHYNITNRLFFLIGCLMFILGVYPYNVVGKIPAVYDFASRDQILVPLGASFILFFGIRLMFQIVKAKYRAQNYVYALVVVVFITGNFSSYLEFQKDWFKQLSIIRNMSTSSIIKDNTTFLFVDHTYRVNAKRRIYRFYEYSALMKSAFGDETRLGVNNGEWGPTFVQTINGVKEYSQYCISNYFFTEPQYKVTINYASYKLSDMNTLRLIWYKYYDKEKYEGTIREIVYFDYIKI